MREKERERLKERWRYENMKALAYRNGVRGKTIRIFNFDFKVTTNMKNAILFEKQSMPNSISQYTRG